MRLLIPILLLAVSGVQAQTPVLAFDVASVRPSAADEPTEANVPLGPGDVYRPTGGRFSAKNYRLLDFISFAWKLSDEQLTDLKRKVPAWIEEERYSIEARTEREPVTKDQLREMMRALLADRFHLTTHTEQREVPIFAVELVTPGTVGPKL